MNGNGHLKKREAAALEKIFAREIDGTLPFQSKAKIYADMEKRGFVENGKRVIGMGDRFPVTVTGWYLTHLGRFWYCQWASKQ